MPKDYPVRNSFNTGEISALCSFRDDIAKYNSACLTLENAVPLVEGGAKKMPGSYFAGGASNGGSMFTGSISGTMLTVTAVNYGSPRAGQVVSGSGVLPNTVIVANNFTGSISGTVLTVTSVSSGNLSVGQRLTGTGILPGTLITSLGSGNGGIGTYNLNLSQVIPSEPMTSAGEGTGIYTVSISQTVAVRLMQTAASGKSRLVSFQFSTAQGAFLEFSAGLVRVWEASSPGQWAIGIATVVSSGNNYIPSTNYTPGNIALVGPFWKIAAWNGTPAGALYIATPYGTSNASTIPISFSLNSSDALSVTVTGSSPNQGINVALANATAAHNAAGFIQTAIRALGSLNSPVSNFVDLSQWTVTPDPTYFANPWTTALPALPTYPYKPANPAKNINFVNLNWIALCVSNNINDQFPIVLGPGEIGPVPTFNSTYWTDGTSLATEPLEIATPYQEQDLFNLDCGTQSADVLWIFHPNYPPAVIERLSANSWQYSLSLPGQQTGQAPYRGTADVIKTGYSGLGQSITGITQANPGVVSVANSSGISPFPSGSRIYINEVAGMPELNQGEFLVSNPTLGSGTASFSLIDPNTGSAINTSGFGSYQSAGFAVQVIPMFANAGDYPACGTLYQERLCVGGSNNNPTQMNGSVQDDYPDFIADPNADDHAIQFTLVSTKLDQILSMIGTPNCLLIGTAGGVWVMEGSNGGSLSQTNVIAAKQTSIGVGQLQPQLVNDSAIFASRSSRIVVFLSFNFVSNEWDTYDLTRLNRNITIGSSQATSGIAQVAFQVEPYPIFWAVRNDGQLIGLVFNKQDQVFAWFRINMLPGQIESVAVITSQGNEDQIAIVVNRTTNGVAQRYIEYFMPQELFGQLSNAFFVNSGQQLNLVPPVAITGILNGSPAQVNAPGHGLSNGMLVQISGVQGMTQVNQDKTQAYNITGVTPNSFLLNGVDSSAWGVYTGGGTVMQVTNQVSGLSYLLGQQVVAVGDGTQILQPTPVTADTMVFQYYANQITIGIPYTMTVQPTNPVIDNQASTTRGMKQKMGRCSIELYQSMGGQYGTDLQHMYDITYGPGSKGQLPAFTTDELTRDVDDEWDDNSTFLIQQSEPFPFTLLGLVMMMSFNLD